MGIARRSLTLLATVLTTAIAGGVDARGDGRPLWLRYPAVSPDGGTIAFCHAGQIWRVDAAGGEASPLTSGEFYSVRPVWSPDGKQIAFSSTVHGNPDVYVMPAEGGEIRRLTYHSQIDVPYAFSGDGRQVYFNSRRLGSADAPHIDAFLAAEQLFQVPAAGGRPRLLVPTPALEVSTSPDGMQLLYENHPTWENEFRKGSKGDGARDIWLYDTASGQHTRQTHSASEDRDAVWAPDGKSFYFLSERDGSFNIYQAELGSAETAKAVTDYTEHPVRFVSVAEDGTLVFGYDGEIYRRPAGAKRAERVPVTVRQGSLVQGPFIAPVNAYITELAVAPDGKEVAIIARGEVFVVSALTGLVRRITDTPEHEGGLSYGPEGKTLLYACERDGDSDIFEASLSPNAQSFLNPGAIVETRIVDTDGDALKPAYSPDGSRIAYFQNRDRLQVFSRADGTTVEPLPKGSFYSYTDDDLEFRWSPDGRWLTTIRGSGVAQTDVIMLDASAKAPPINISNSGYNDKMPMFSAGGKVVVWASGRDGLRTADANAAQHDFYAAFLTRELYDSFKLARDPQAVATPAASRPGADAAGDEMGAAPAWQPQLSGLAQRTERLTPFSVRPIFSEVTADGSALILVVIEMPGRAVGYRIDLHTHGLGQLFVKPLTTATYAMDPAGKTLYGIGAAGLERIDLATGQSGTIPFTAEMALDPRGEMAYYFQHFWKLTKSKFYVPDMQGVDWDAARETYAKFLPHIHAWEDYAEMMSEMAGELNASHMGCFFRPKPPYADSTGSLGIYYDHGHQGAGQMLAAVLPGGPSDLAGSALQPGAVIRSIDGEPVEATTSIHALLDGKVGVPVQLSVLPADGSDATDVVVTPVDGEGEIALAYEHWVSLRKEMAGEMSGGRVGYIHIGKMEEPEYRRAFSEVFGEMADKEALVVDVRFNGGGFLHDQLVTLFTGESTANFTDRDGRVVGIMPGTRWTKPTACLADAASYSDGSIFPHIYKSYAIGPLVGERTPGTGTAVWWIDVLNRQVRYGIPQIGAKDTDGDWFENHPSEPDILILRDPNAISEGRDPMLEGAVKALMEKLD